MYVLLGCTCIIGFYLISARVIVVVLLLNHYNRCQSPIQVGQLSLHGVKVDFFY